MDIFADYLIVYAVVWYTCFAGSVSAGQSLAETDQFFMRKALILILSLRPYRRCDPAHQYCSHETPCRGSLSGTYPLV